MLFVNPTHPYLQIYNPATGGFAKFVGGKLELDESDPNFGVVMAEATRNPLISIHEHVATCDQCGESYTGRTAAADLGKHRKAVHFDVWLADQDAKASVLREKEIKARAGFACDVCQPVQTFGTPEALAEHARKLHATAPELTESGETVGGDEGGGGAPVDTEIPAATPAGG